MTAGRTANSPNKHWGTPPEYVAVVRKILGGVIHLDPCSNEWSIVNAITEYRLPTNGLKESWDFPTIYVNPPYGRDSVAKTSIRDWLQRCTDANKRFGSEVIALIPVATNTKHWQQNIFKNATAICFLAEPRLKFLQNGTPHPKGAPMSCALVYWGKNPSLFAACTSQLGATFII